MFIHSVFLKALDLVNDFNIQQIVGEAPLASRLAVCRSENFNALVPIIVSRLFLETKTLELFLNAPTYKYATALRIYLHPIVVNDDEGDRKSFFEQDKFVAFSNPLRFLEIVRFSTSLLDLRIGTDEQRILVERIDNLVKTHILPLHFLKSAEIFQDESDVSINRVSPFVKYKVDDGVRDYWCWHRRSIPPAAVDAIIPIPYFRLLKHKNEKVRTGAAVELSRALTDAGRDPAVLRDFHRPTLAKGLVQVGILDVLFHLLSNRIEEEASWSQYLQLAGAVVWKNPEVNFEKHIEPHLDQIRFFLSVKNPNLLYHVAFFLSNLQQGRSDMIKHCLGKGLIESVVELMKDGNNNITKTNNETENDDNSSEPAIAPPQPYWYPAIRVLGNFSAESPELAKKLIEFRFFENVKPRLKVHSNNSCEVRKEILWTTSNLLIDFKREFIESDLLPLVLENARDTEHREVQREALFVLWNLFVLTPNSQDDDQVEEEIGESETISAQRAVFRYALSGAHSNFIESLEPFILSIFADNSNGEVKDYQTKESLTRVHNLMKNKSLVSLNHQMRPTYSKLIGCVVQTITTLIEFECGVAKWYVKKRMILERKRAGDKNYANVDDMLSEFAKLERSDDYRDKWGFTSSFGTCYYSAAAPPRDVATMPRVDEVKTIEHHVEKLHNESIHSERLRQCQEVVKAVDKNINNNGNDEEELARVHAELETELKSMMEKVKAFSAKHDEFNSLIKHKMKLKKLELEDFRNRKEEEKGRRFHVNNNIAVAKEDSESNIEDAEASEIDDLLWKNVGDIRNHPEERRMFFEANLNKKPEMSFYTQLKKSLLLTIWDDFTPLASKLLLDHSHDATVVVPLKSAFDVTKKFVQNKSMQKYLKLYDETAFQYRPGY